MKTTTEIQNAILEIENELELLVEKLENETNDDLINCYTETYSDLESRLKALNWVLNIKED